MIVFLALTKTKKEEIFHCSLSLSSNSILAAATSLFSFFFSLVLFPIMIIIMIRALAMRDRIDIFQYACDSVFLLLRSFVRSRHRRHSQQSIYIDFYSSTLFRYFPISRDFLISSLGKRCPPQIFKMIKSMLFIDDASRI